MTPPPPEYRSRSNLEGYADLQLNIARSAAARCSAEAGVLRQRFAREYAAVGSELGILQGHARRVVEGSRSLATGDERGVQCVEDVRPELERFGLFEFPEVELSHDGRVND